MHDDDDLLARLTGSPEQKEEAIRDLRDILLRGLSKSLNNRYGQPFSAEDIVQDALMKILSSLDQFEGRCKFTTWAMTVATRIGISSLRRKYHQDVSLEAFDGRDQYRIEIAIEQSFNRSELNERYDIVQKLQQLIDTELTDKQREVVVRRFGLRGHESSTLEDVGLEIGLTRERVRQIQVEGLKRLREILEKNGLSSESLFQ